MPCAPKSNSIAQAVDNAVRCLVINRNAFHLLLSDSARCMVAAGVTSKSLYLNMFRVTCVLNLLRNCAMKVKSHFEDVDQQIVKVKSATVKNQSRQAKFDTIGCPPQPVVIRWEAG